MNFLLYNFRRSSKSGENMKDLAYYNGKIDSIENMTVPMNDRVSFFGDGVYDVTYARHHKPYTLDEHLERFYSSAEQLRIAVPLPKNELADLLCELIKKVDAHEQWVYWQVTRGTAPRNFPFSSDMKANLWVTIRECPVTDTYRTLRTITVEDTRYLHCNIKTLNLIPNVMAEQKAKENGYDTAIFCRGERVTECAHANIHILKDGKLITPPADNLILPGIARQNILKFTKILGIETVIRPFTKDEMMNADEVILSSAGSFCVRIGEIDGVKVGSKDSATLRRLQDALVNDFLTATE